MVDWNKCNNSCWYFNKVVVGALLPLCIFFLIFWQFSVQTGFFDVLKIKLYFSAKLRYLSEELKMSWEEWNLTLKYIKLIFIQSLFGKYKRFHQWFIYDKVFTSVKTVMKDGLGYLEKRFFNKKLNWSNSSLNLLLVKNKLLTNLAKTKYKFSLNTKHHLSYHEEMR